MSIASRRVGAPAASRAIPLLHGWSDVVPARLRVAWRVLLFTVVLLVPGVCARAGTEEFSTFGVESQEEDDESLLDHFLVRMPRAWRDEWERSPQAIRTAQGCLTSGQWFLDTDLKLRTPLGNRARFGLTLRQSESDVSSYDYLDFSFAFPTRWGTPGAMFRPLHDKSRQDFALTWEAGSDTSGLQIQTVFGFEDVFNNLWAFRQDRVGDESEPYERRPYEPALRIVTRQPGWRAELGGLYLTPSRKRVVPWVEGASPREATLWGTLARAEVEVEALGVRWEASAHNQQARSTDLPLDGSDGDSHDFRRRWSVELGVLGRVVPRVTLEARGLYQDRDQDYRPPLADGSFGAIDRLVALESQVELTKALTARVGVMHDRIGVAHAGRTRWTSYGTRTESRAFIGLMARFGRVRLNAIEGIELDPEPYEVWWVHDKGFLHLQATF